MRHFRETIYKRVFTILAFASLLFLTGIVLTLFVEAYPFLVSHDISRTLFGLYWYPTYDPPEFGMLPLITASFVVTLGAMVVCIPIGVGTALFLHELASASQRAVLKPLIEILAGIPSIIFGFFGMIIVAPFIQGLLDIPVGLNAFTASLVLGIMATPTVASLTEDAVSFVPRSFREASLALGATRWQTLIRVVVPAAGSGISTAIILGIGRAVGETMVVLMVAGGAAVIPGSVFDPVRPMTATIAAEMGEAVMGSPHYNALFAIGLTLFFITLAINIVAEIISRRFRLKLGLGR
ncbi:MAG: phosphate ABC transporter permease subunit PstC [Pseudomonadota bacterium]|jgi:phosphate transport system permease protein|nr:phosphate ABC transporter permease subunit PstC [Pseudomonadota bacterium]HON63119.1 phosphate ABC transporter permease subunit PstC [Deltaproteobacteria bacterium]HPD22235.1 phosphate ABC transporter permease subunit PstC [Deltaproteobacteria bacterium]HRS57068.1 phosphate ABC transporter permease subunit PstC [Desulfomonilia bacterium]HRV36664.1 phosphate ABC transporter permease subunit PstC [Desulfomonilia bacterium]